MIKTIKNRQLRQLRQAISLNYYIGELSVYHMTNLSKLSKIYFPLET